MTEPEAGTTAARLWQLLPAVYRLRDGEAGGVLAELLDVFGDQLDVLGEELAQLYDDQFVETAAPWATPYIGGVVGYRPIHGVVPEVVSPRAEVANTVAYRRRKGTAAVIEQLAADVTGWPARVYESFERLATTQYMNHTRPHAVASASMRDHEALHHVAPEGAAFDDLAHTAHARPLASTWREHRGRYGIVKIPIFLWRTQPVRLERSPLTPDPSVDGRRFRFDPLGADTRLFAQPRIETEISHLAEPPDVPQPLTVRWAADHAPAVYGPTLSRARRSILLERQTGAGEPVAIPLADVRFADLSDAPGGATWAHEPPAGQVYIDPARGRVWLGDAPPAGEQVLATFSIGMAVPVGAGNRRRGDEPLPAPEQTVSDGDLLQPALDLVQDGGTVLVADSRRYAQNLTITAHTPDPTADPGSAVCLAAAQGARPSLELTKPLLLDMEPRSTVVLDGVLLSGAPVVLDEVDPPDRDRRTIVIRDATLVPGLTRTPDGAAGSPTRASLIVLDPFACVRIERSVVGAIVAVEGVTVEVTDSIIDGSARTGVALTGRDGASPRTVASDADWQTGDGTAAAGDLDIRESTVVGSARCVRLDASNSLFLATLEPGDPRPRPVHVERKQQGCVRYSFLPEGSQTGRRFHCAPRPDDPVAVQRASRPRFDSMRFGDHDYLRLHEGTPDRIRRGADDESEMGVTHRLYAPQREANLRIRLDEYLRFGLAADRIFAT
ncbi:hypothetical protein [Microbacterium sp. SS28]|uniref:hypothetical protein n=1 Tax=Microbacterium sp. SS28 TaxID=2919948 RepID=UPI001FAAC4DE|nr:hypothetical protein [Microbacterium sp. SS28]